RRHTRSKRDWSSDVCSSDLAEFEINDTTQSLVLLKSLDEEDPNAAFLAFSDKTSGEETYGGGRYIDLQLKNDRRVIIDFNKAYRSEERRVGKECRYRWTEGR